MSTVRNEPTGDQGPILLIAGSPSAPSRSARLLEYFDTLLVQAGYVTDGLIVSELPAEALLHGDLEDPLLRAAQKRVARAQAIIVATPVYKAAYSGVLKAFFDLLPQDALAGKAALALVTEGNSKHRTLTDFAVRQLLSALSAGHVLPTVFALDKQIEWSPETGLVLDAKIKRLLQDRAQQLQARLNIIEQAANQHQTDDPAGHRLAEVRSS